MYYGLDFYGPFTVPAPSYAGPHIPVIPVIPVTPHPSSHRSQWPSLIGCSPVAHRLSDLAARLHSSSPGGSNQGIRGGGGPFPSHLQALVAAQLHHAASAAHAQAGDSAAAAEEAQHALRVASALFRISGATDGSDDGASPLTAVPAGHVEASSSIVDDPMDVDSDPMDVDLDLDPTTSKDPGPSSRSLVDRAAAPAASGTTGTGAGAGTAGLSSDLVLPAMSQYVCSLVRAASSLEAVGGAEEAVALLREARASAAALGGGEMQVGGTWEGDRSG